MKHQLVNSTIIGCGGMARHHVRQISANFPFTRFLVLCEPSPEMAAEMVKVFRRAGQKPI